MTENITVFGEIADRYDALVAYDEKLLDNWVEEGGYSLSSMVLASTAKSFMTFAKGFVDVGRIGNGILVEGGVKGAANAGLSPIWQEIPFISNSYPATRRSSSAEETV